MTKWSYEEDLKAYQLHHQGLSYKEMEQHLPGRTAGAIAQRMSRKGLQLHPPIDPEKTLDGKNVWDIYPTWKKEARN